MKIDTYLYHFVYSYCEIELEFGTNRISTEN